MHVIVSLSQFNRISVTLHPTHYNFFVAFWGFFFFLFSKTNPVMIHHETQLLVSAMLAASYLSFTHSHTYETGAISFIAVIQ